MPQGAQKSRAASRLGRAVAAVCIGGIRFYQLALSPLKHMLLGLGAGCRFRPTCSAYAIDCFRQLPPWRAACLAVRRILRCHPWGGSGYDPAPLAGEIYARRGESRTGSLKDLLRASSSPENATRRP